VKAWDMAFPHMAVTRLLGVLNGMSSSQAENNSSTGSEFIVWLHTAD